ncbi:MAG: tRNA (N6-threonylcarbamoyladenosine(37)-N6)-methyltransferase TrmO [Clostridia bacterium]|nr:tRNA (N6-threonylcarbamoyladenosine(37)-N6)-methyltransferase TrmO [Clostridia bacterium]
MEIIAHLHNDFPTKFGLPRQSGLVDTLESVIVFTPEYRVPEALRGLEDFSHLWLLWQFHQAQRETWSPTVRPPRLGGNARIGVFATRSPFRPNPIGLTCVKLEKIVRDSRLGHVLYVTGADMVDGTPILDIKPYIPYADCRPDASGSFADVHAEDRLQVDFPTALLSRVPEDRRATLLSALAQDPRPAYQHDPDRVYGLPYAGLDVKFRIEGDTLIVTDVQ